VALKVVGSNPTIRPKVLAYLAELVDAIDLKFIPFLGCWFKSNSEQLKKSRNIAKWLRHSFLIRTSEGSSPSTPSIQLIRSNWNGSKTFQPLFHRAQ
jgi:hypothetical protein